MKKKLFWFSWQPTPYNDTLFRLIHQESKLDLFVVYRSRIESSHPWKTPLASGYNKVYYNNKWGIDFKSIIYVFKNKNAHFVLAGWDHPTAWIVLSLLNIFNRSYSVWTDTPNNITRNKNVKERLRSAWLKWILSNAKCNLATGDIGISALLHIGGDKSKMIALPFFLDLDKYSNWENLSKKFNNIESFVFTSSGRLLNSMKGHDLAIDALYNAFKQSHYSWKYFIAGKGPDEDRLRSLVKSLSLENNVFFLGWVEPDDLIDILKGSHFLLHPSRSHDPFPNAVLEGMAAGNIVLASDKCGSALDRIENGNNGFIHSAGDCESLTSQIKDLINIKSDVLSSIAEKSRKKAEEWPLSRAIELVERIAL